MEPDGRSDRTLDDDAPMPLLVQVPAAALGVAQTAQVLALIHRLREQGLAIVVSHDLDTVSDVADRIAAASVAARPSAEAVAV
jgi:D-xylose transport system ATP-binding protein